MIIFEIIGPKPMRNFEIGDRVEIAADAADAGQSRIGIIIAASEILPYKMFTIRLADGSECRVGAAQIRIEPPRMADMIFDTTISPAPAGLRGSARGRHMRFVSGDLDIHIKVKESEFSRNLFGQLNFGQLSLDPSLVTLLCDGKPHATTATNPDGEFELHEIPSGDMMLEVLLPSRRIIAAFPAA